LYHILGEKVCCLLKEYEESEDRSERVYPTEIEETTIQLKINE
jgi:hypothetical protein